MKREVSRDKESMEKFEKGKEESGTSNNLPHSIFPMGLLPPELMELITGYAGADACANPECALLTARGMWMLRVMSVEKPSISNVRDTRGRVSDTAKKLIYYDCRLAAVILSDDQKV
jgi:hypothetical protein